MTMAPSAAEVQAVGEQSYVLIQSADSPHMPICLTKKTGQKIIIKFLW